MIRVKTESPVYGGFMIARGDAAGDGGAVVFVKGALPGETVHAEVSEKKKDYSIATVSEVLEPSDLRVEPFCPYFGPSLSNCGGCHLQHAAYDGQVSMKNSIIIDSFRRIGGIEVEPAAPITGPNTGYRHRAQFKVSAEGAVGFFSEGTRDVVPVRECPLLVHEINEALGKIILMPLEGVKEVHVTLGYEGEPEEGGLTGPPEPGLLDAAGRPAPGLAALIKGREFDEVLAGQFADCGFETVFFEDGSHRGKGFVNFGLRGFKYSVSPLSFFQSNWRLNLKAVDAVKELLGTGFSGSLLDIYAGGGNFSIPMSPSAKRITCVEDSVFSIKDGVRNIELNGIKNMKFLRSSFERFSFSGKGQKSFDAVIVDPPRPGLSREAAKKLLELLPEKLLYISCNPATLARDVKKLSEKYKVESVRLADFFPHTYHIEVLCLLGMV